MKNKGVCFWTVGWQQRQKLFNQPDEAGRKPRTVGCRSAQREGGRLAEGRRGWNTYP
jgi:hypothetical protein